MRTVLIMALFLCLVSLAGSPITAFAQEAVEAAPTGWDVGNVAAAIKFLSELPIVGQYVAILLAAIGFLSALAAFLPIGTPGSFWWKFRKIVIDLGAMNWGNAANKKNS